MHYKLNVVYTFLYLLNIINFLIFRRNKIYSNSPQLRINQ